MAQVITIEPSDHLGWYIITRAPGRTAGISWRLTYRAARRVAARQKARWSRRLTE